MRVTSLSVRGQMGVIGRSRETGWGWGWGGGKEKLGRESEMAKRVARDHFTQSVSQQGANTLFPSRKIHYGNKHRHIAQLQQFNTDT